MSPEISETMIHLPTACKVWDHTATTFSGKGNLSRICSTYSQWMNLRRGDTPLSTFYSQFVSHCQQLDVLMPLTTDLTTTAQQRDQIRVVQFLDTLGLEYMHFRQQIFGSGTIPSLQEVYLRAQQCTLGDSVLAPSVDITVIAAYGVGDRATRGGGTFGRGRGHDFGRGGRDLPAGRGGRPRPYCSHSRREGHYMESCYVLHPELRPSSEARFGHSAHLVAPDSFDPSSASVPLSTRPQVDGVFMSGADHDELQRLKSTSHSPTATSAQPGSSPASLLTSSSSWIIDFGASNHMTGSLDWEDDWLRP
ncbi:uncharacterized protein LOC143879451 [Tasmannia lanceolata]|uniref:uncharacterized protein LOC143879451 n=1 Tax=Tasmannia lanceolata TaxID=3420 RepID=UPI0040631631